MHCSFYCPTLLWSLPIGYNLRELGQNEDLFVFDYEDVNSRTELMAILVKWNRTLSLWDQSDLRLSVYLLLYTGICTGLTPPPSKHGRNARSHLVSLQTIT